MWFSLEKLQVLMRERITHSFECWHRREANMGNLKVRYSFRKNIQMSSEWELCFLCLQLRWYPNLTWDFWQGCFHVLIYLRKHFDRFKMHSSASNFRSDQITDSTAEFFLWEFWKQKWNWARPLHDKDVHGTGYSFVY